MSLNKGYGQYKEQAVSTMTNAEMLITLYDEAIKRLNRAKLALNDQNFTFFESELERAREIIDYLDKTLDWQYPISGNLHSLYEFMTFEIARAKAARKGERLDDIIPMVKELRDTFMLASK